MQLVFLRTRDAKDSEKYSSVQGYRADLSDGEVVCVCVCQHWSLCWTHTRNRRSGVVCMWEKNKELEVNMGAFAQTGSLLLLNCSDDPGGRPHCSTRLL